PSTPAPPPRARPLRCRGSAPPRPPPPSRSGHAPGHSCPRIPPGSPVTARAARSNGRRRRRRPRARSHTARPVRVPPAAPPRRRSAPGSAWTGRDHLDDLDHALDGPPRPGGHLVRNGDLERHVTQAVAHLGQRYLLHVPAY